MMLSAAASPGPATVSESVPKPAGPAPAAPATAFEALLAATGIPLMLNEPAMQVPAESPEATTADELKVDSSDEDAAEPPSPLALWMQWMRPLATTAKAPEAVGDAEVGVTADAAQVAPALVAKAETLVLGSLPKTAAGETETLDGAMTTELPSEPAVPEAPAAATQTPFATVIKAMDSNAVGATVVPDSTLTAVQLAPPAPTGATAPQPLAAPLPINTRQPDWNQQLGERIAWSLDEQQDAVIELHPAELGSLSVRVEMRGNDAQVTIVAATAAARDMLQQSLPQLRELLSMQGLNLARAQVERPGGANASGQGQTETGSRERGGGLRSRRQVSSLLLVDAYA